ncbi:hypothetical protein DH2020_008713 [Rehmannia glutinosa]|uniref:RRM domain-containing protein n=1 Tax=Rehmannia glutinosa TaxID=99300 RepID=A0ABR0X7M7_REHGL
MRIVLKNISSIWRGGGGSDHERPTTGRARGFGFVVFSDPAAAERVVKEKHMIDGRTVEAKKAVPRDDQHLISRNSGSIQGSPGPGRTKRFLRRSYVRPQHSKAERFWVYNVIYSEDAVDRVLHKTFHELNGKMVEVKRAVPKEMSPGPNRGPLVGYNYGFSRGSNFLNSYPQGYNLSSLGGYGVRMDGRYNALGNARAGFSHFGSPAYGMGMNMEQSLNAGFGGGSNFSGNVGYGRVLNPYFGNAPNRYNTPTPIGYNTSNSRGDSFFNSPSRNVWGNGGINNAANNASSGSYFGSGSGGFGVFRNAGANWGSSNTASVGGSSSGYNGGNVGYRGGENNYALGSGGFGRNGGTGVATTSSFSAASGGYEGSYGEFYRSGSVYGDPTWQTTSSELDNSGSFGYALGNSEDVTAKDSEDYGVGYDIPNRQSNRGYSRYLISIGTQKYCQGLSHEIKDVRLKAGNLGIPRVSTAVLNQGKTVDFVVIPGCNGNQDLGAKVYMLRESSSFKGFLRRIYCGRSDSSFILLCDSSTPKRYYWLIRKTVYLLSFSSESKYSAEMEELGIAVTGEGVI